MAMNRDELARRVEDHARVEFSKTPLTQLLRGGYPHATKTVKAIFCELGKSLGYEVAAAGCRGADEGEWLYDLVWYVMDSGLIIQQPMVLESEWKHGVLFDEISEVDGDFQKLVQARADVRVWVSTAPDNATAQTHIANCKEQVRRFEGTMKGDTYIFIINEYATPDTVIERWQF